MKGIYVIPEPKSLKVLSEAAVFTLTDNVSFECCDAGENSLNELLTFLREVFSLEPLGMGREKIRFEIDASIEEEGYLLKAESDRVILRGGSERGLFYAVQTLKQLLFCTQGELPAIEITDAPRYAVRGFMLDCGRYFFTVEAVKQFIDMIALHKLNEFHWHLSEDQGFRCQLEGKLLLTEIGSYRSHTNFNTVPHEGYYTRADMLEIISYAHSKYIKVIPEIDSPGHVQAMLAAYPELACFPRDFDVSTSWGVRHDVLCVGKESTIAFMKELFDELTEIFTDGVVHLGGDEVPTLRWRACPHCQRLMKEKGMKDESDLHTYYLDTMAEHLRKKGIEVRMWNDRVKENMTDRSLTWQLWNDAMKDGEVAAELNGGRKFVLSCSRWFYLNLPYAEVSLEKAYSFEFEPEGLTDEGRRNIIGISGCLWTEFIPDMLTADKMTYPRLAAVSENAWSPKDKKDYGAFTEKLGSYYALLGSLGVRPESLKKTAPKGVKRLAGRLWWQRRQLTWGAYGNIISDIRAKKIK